MEKYVGTYADGFRTAVWAAGDDNARFHLKDWCRIHGDLVDMKKIRPLTKEEQSD